MQTIKRLIKSINIDDEQIPEEEIVQVFLLIKKTDNLKKIRSIVNKTKLTNKQKRSLFNYINHILMADKFIHVGYFDYVQQVIKLLPMTKEQRVAIEYELSKYNKKRFKFN